MVIVQSGYVKANGMHASTQRAYARSKAESGANFLDTRPPSNPPIMFANPKAAKIHATRCATPS